LQLLFLAFVLPVAAAQNSCVGYVKAGDITVRCGNVVTVVTQWRDAHQFAVSEDGATLVLESERAGERQFELVSLKSDKVTQHPWRANGGLLSSRGTVALRESDDGGYRMRDFTSDRVFAIDPYIDFVCSSDRATVAGLVGSSPVALKIGSPPGTPVATAAKPNLIQFSLSPTERESLTQPSR